MVDLRVVKVATLRITVSAGSLYRLVITAVPFLLTLEFQLVFGWTPFASGLMVAALFAGNLAIKPATTPLMRRFGIRRVLLFNALASVGCFGLLAALRPALPVAVMAAILFLSGALRSIGFTAYNSLAFSDVEREESTHATPSRVRAGVGGRSRDRRCRTDTQPVRAAVRRAGPRRGHRLRMDVPRARRSDDCHRNRDTAVAARCGSPSAGADFPRRGA